jgi:protein TonB
MGRFFSTGEEHRRMGAAISAALILHLLVFALLRIPLNMNEKSEQNRNSSPTRISLAAPVAPASSAAPAAPAVPAEASRPAEAADSPIETANTDKALPGQPTKQVREEISGLSAEAQSAEGQSAERQPAAAADRSPSPYNPPDIQELFISILHQRIRQNLVYPISARSREIEGSVVIRLEIASDGRLLTSTLEKSSGNRTLDQAADRLISALFPFDIQPGEPIRCSVEIVYRLNPA